MPPLPKTWDRREEQGGSGTQLIPGPFLIGSSSAATGVSDTLIRGIWSPGFDVYMGTPLILPDTWWHNCVVMWCASFGDNGDTTPLDPQADDSRIIATARLYPTLVGSVTNPGQYYVKYRPLEPEIFSDGQRRGSVTSALFPTTNSSMSVDDPSTVLFNFGNVHGVHLAPRDYMRTLWGHH